MPYQSIIPNNEEIEKALKEFESNKEKFQSAPNQVPPSTAVDIRGTSQAQTPRLEGVIFDTDTEAGSYSAIKFYKETVEPKMVKAVIKYSNGVVKNQRQAEWVLLGFAIAAILVSVFLFSSGGRVSQQKLSPELIEKMKQIETTTNH